LSHMQKHPLRQSVSQTSAPRAQRSSNASGRCPLQAGLRPVAPHPTRPSSPFHALLHTDAPRRLRSVPQRL